MGVNGATAQNFNRYSYAANSPYAKYDPSGRESGCITDDTSCVDEAGVVMDLQTIGSDISDAIDWVNANIPPGPDNPLWDLSAIADGAQYVAAAVGIASDAKVVTEATQLAAETSDVPIAKTFTSTDPLVGELATKIDAVYPGHVLGVNVPVLDETGQVLTDIDILLKNGIVEVKSGGGKGLTTQMATMEQYTGMPVIGYGPNLKWSILRNCTATDCEQTLLDVIAP
jgi:hypothetical protein